MSARNSRYKLTATFVKKSPSGKFNDGGGLWFDKRGESSAKWFFRFTFNGRRREMGLGSLQSVSLERARQKAHEARRLVADGVDPISERNRLRTVNRFADTRLETIAHATFEARKSALRDDGKAGRWFSPLEHHILPELGKVRVEELNQRLISEVLKPIWHSKAPTAKKAINRLNMVIRHAAALDLDVDIQATDKAKALLGVQRHQVAHISAMPWSEVPEFYASLNKATVGHFALKLLILTGHRLKPVRYINLDQIDGSTWTVPPELLKGRKGASEPFRTHLSNEALKVIAAVKPFARDGFLFASSRNGVISDATMSRMMERRKTIYRPHGFRTSLREWLEDETGVGYEVKEAMLQHKVGSSVERAYRRTDYLEKRRSLYEMWGAYVSQGSNEKK